MTSPPYLLAYVAGNFLAGHFARKLGEIKGIMLAASFLSFIGYVGLTFVGPNREYLILAAYVLVALGLGICMVGTIMLTQNSAPSKDVGAATGALLLLRAVGSMVGGAAAGGALQSSLAIRGGGQALHGEAAALGLDLSVVPNAFFSTTFLALAAVLLLVAVAVYKMPQVMLRGDAAS